MLHGHGFLPGRASGTSSFCAAAWEVREQGSGQQSCMVSLSHLGEQNSLRVHPSAHVEHLCLGKGASDPVGEGTSAPSRASTVR